MTMTLVLAGGGPAALAWELGVLRGLADADAGLAQKVIDADTVIGTSGGSSVAAQITSGTPLDELHDAQLSAGTTEIEVKLDLTEFISRFGAAIAGAVDEMDRRRRVGAFGLAATTVPEAKRRAVIAARLPAAHWPERDLRIPAVNAVTGEVVIFTRDSGVRLVDAVAASCAVPGIWPPASIGDRRYVDGGVRSSTNADLAADADQILLITPTRADAPAPSLGGDLRAELDALSNSRIEVIYADQDSMAFLGNPLAIDTRAPAARAGRAVGRTAAARVARLFG
ncbi:MAG TPA: patatin-like phospholipase family protein [Trebonia sp.]|jgi:NTE family protein|nr:patatin-like phospholipase family protein [Trebonia sp.]